LRVEINPGQLAAGLKEGFAEEPGASADAEHPPRTGPHERTGDGAFDLNPGDPSGRARAIRAPGETRFMHARTSSAGGEIVRDHRQVVDVAVEPAFARFEGLNQCMSCVVGVVAGVVIGGGVAAAYVPAGQA
jgi:hypothetical protein